jgi:dTDP-4-dehydrorhamnose 3,5-epimerase
MRAVSSVKTATAKPKRNTLPLGEANGLRLALVKRPSRDIGDVILAPDSPKLIAAVSLEAGALYPDDRGYFTELFRVGASPFSKDLADCKTLQISLAASFSGTIKALHYHFEQTDYWAPIQGAFQVVLCDLREGSPTHGEVNTLYLGLLRPWRLKIPPGVGHGYKVVGCETGMLVYLTDRFYNPRDEGRLPYDHPFLNYDWDTQHK